MTTDETPTLAQMYAYLLAVYKHERFVGRNSHWPQGMPEGCTYAEALARDALVGLAEHGHGCVSRHESRTGDVIEYTAATVIAHSAA